MHYLIYQLLLLSVIQCFFYNSYTICFILFLLGVLSYFFLHIKCAHLRDNSGRERIFLMIHKLCPSVLTILPSILITPLTHKCLIKWPFLSLHSLGSLFYLLINNILLPNFTFISLPQYYYTFQGLSLARIRFYSPIPS